MYNFAQCCGFRNVSSQEVSITSLPGEKFDDIDFAILAVLQNDGRASFSVMARELGYPESTVRIRTRKLLESGLVSVVATGDPLKLGIPVDALCIVTLDPSQVSEVAETLSAMPEVRYVGVALGGGTLIVESLHQSALELHSYLSRKLAGIPGVKEVTTHQIVDIKKSVWDWKTWLQAARSSSAPSSHKE